MKTVTSGTIVGKKRSYPIFTEAPKLPQNIESHDGLHVPWLNQKEWLEVREKVFSPNINDVDWAIGRISAWNAKTATSISAGALCTATLCTAKVRDIQRIEGALEYSKNEITMLYGMAIIRFINLVSDLGRTSKGGVRIDIAQTMNIPTWIVQLRNEASHGTMPSYERLKKAVYICLEWLRLNYWEKEEKNLMDYTKCSIVPSINIENTDTGNEEQVIRAYLKEFQTEHFDFIYNRQKNRRFHIFFKITQLGFMFNTNPDRFTSILTETGFLILRYHHLDAILKSEEKDYLDNESVCLPRSLERFWIPILEIYNSNPDTFNRLILSLLKLRSDPLEQRVATSWALRFLEICVNMEQCDLKVPSSLRWKELLAVSLKNPNKYCTSILKVIAEKVQINTAMKNCLMGLVAIRLGSLVDRKKNNHFSKQKMAKKGKSKINTVEELKIVMRKELKLDKVKIPKGPWKLCKDDVNWRSIPLGLLPADFPEPENHDDQEQNSLKITEIVETDQINSKNGPKVEEIENDKDEPDVYEVDEVEEIDSKKEVNISASKSVVVF